MNAAAAAAARRPAAVCWPEMEAKDSAAYVQFAVDA